jgi:hypothetical protein
VKEKSTLGAFAAETFAAQNAVLVIVGNMLSAGMMLIAGSMRLENADPQHERA